MGGKKLILDNSKPIYIQIAEWIETEILKGNIKPHNQVYSQYKLAEMFTINPATAAKGLNLLADERILYDKRGIGKFVSAHAIAIIKNKRLNKTLKNLIDQAVREASYLNISEQELLNMIKDSYNTLKEENK